MYTSRVAVLGVIAYLVLLCGSPDVHAGLDFQGLGHLAGGTSSRARSVSADGSVVVGDASYYEEETFKDPPAGLSGVIRYFEAFRWTSAEGMMGIGIPAGQNESRATGVSGDGTTIVGGADTVGSFSADSEAFRWTAAEGRVKLDFGLYSNGASAVSANGGVIVGIRRTALPGPILPDYSKQEAVRWSASTGAVAMTYFGADTGFSAVSADGGVMVGGWSVYSLVSNTSEAIRWTEAEGILGLGHLPGATMGGAADVSSDGLVIVGSERFGSFSIESTYYEAFRWTSGGGMVGLGWLAGWEGSRATAVSGDGSIVVGNLFMGFPPHGIIGDPPAAPRDAAFIWKESMGMLILKDLLLARGVDGLDGWTLTEVTGISADGRTVVGMGVNPAGQEEAWMTAIPEPSSLVLLAVGGLAALRRTRFA